MCDDDARIDLSLAERVAIAAHHGKLGARHEHRWVGDGEPEGEFADLWRELQGRARQPRGTSAALSTPRSSGGTRSPASARSSNLPTRAPAAPRRAGSSRPSSRFITNGRTAAGVRSKTSRCAHADDPVTILRAPTGSGKTDAALLWGQHQVDHGRADRVVVAMPTRFTANALAVSSADVALGHRPLPLQRVARPLRGRQWGTAEFDLAKEQHGLARRLATPLTVCTVDHLLLSLTGTKEDHHSAFFFLANAAVVFDEVDFYDPFVQANLVVLLAALRTLRVPVLLMSATVPESARQLYAVETEIRHTTAESSGTRRLHRHAPIERPEDAAEVLDAMIEAGTGIVYANTVERAYHYWTFLQSRAGDLPVYLYHSRYTEPDKKRVEDALVAALGRKAWDPSEPGRPRGIAVLTQIGEMSINVSAPLMLSDLCPWDRLAQRAGRLARFKDLIPEGDLHVADPHRDGALYPAPYGSFDGPTVGWTAGQPLLDTQARLDTLTADGPLDLDPARLVCEVDALYPEPEVFDNRTRANATQLEQMIRENWMLVPKKEPREAEADVQGEWKSRDIPGQVVLYLLSACDLPEHGPLRFRTYDEFHRLQLEKGVACPHYLAERGVKRGMVSAVPFAIGDADSDDALFWCVSGYDPPDEHGRGGGLGALSAREAEDSFGRVSL